VPHRWVDSLHSQASATVRTGCFSKDSRIKSRSAAISLTGRLGFHSRGPSKPPSRNVEHDRGEPPGSTALAARRARYPSPEQMDRKMLRNVEKRGAQAARNGPSEDRKCWRRIELGVHGLNKWTVNCLEMSRKRGVQAARNGPSLPPCVAKAEMSTADRLGSRQGSRAGWRKPVGCVELAMTHRSASRCVFATHPNCWRPGSVVCPQRSPGTCSPAPRPMAPAENWVRFACQIPP
jgi:hypothetical protein